MMITQLTIQNNNQIRTAHVGLLSVQTLILKLCVLRLEALLVISRTESVWKYMIVVQFKVFIIAENRD